MGAWLHAVCSLSLFSKMVLRSFRFAIPAGKMVALCGPSGKRAPARWHALLWLQRWRRPRSRWSGWFFLGAGKSTIAALLERFYDPTEGAGGPQRTALCLDQGLF